MSGWTVLHRYVTPIDPDHGGAPTTVTVWRDNLGGLVLGIDEADGRRKVAIPLPRAAAKGLGAALQDPVR